MGIHMSTSVVRVLLFLLGYLLSTTNSRLTACYVQLGLLSILPYVLLFLLGACAGRSSDLLETRQA